MTERDKEIIIALADCNMNENAVARRLYVHRNSVVYRSSCVKKKTGLDPTNFYDLAKLVEMVKEPPVEEQNRAREGENDG